MPAGLPAWKLRRAAALRSRATRGDAAAFTALYERHHQALYRYCRSILHHDEDARDALQSTMAKAYGRYCQGFSKKHVAGTPGTPFSRCVTAMAKLANDKSDSPREACKGLSKKHVAGQKGTPFSRCVVAGAKLLHDQDDDQDES